MTTTAMRVKREQLQKSAMESATFRGHKMTPFATLYEQRHIAESICEKCEAYVQVNAKPEANGIDIGGTAVALNCHD